MPMQIRRRTSASRQIFDLPAERTTELAEAVGAISPASAEYYEEHLITMSKRRRIILYLLEELEREDHEYYRRRSATAPGAIRPWLGVPISELENRPILANRLDVQKTVDNYKKIEKLNAERSYKASAVKGLFSVEKKL